MNKIFSYLFFYTIIMYSCNVSNPEENSGASKEIEWQIDRFADTRILRYTVPGFDSLSLQQKKLVYFLARAGQAGRNILFDQNCKYNLFVKNALEQVYLSNKDKESGEEWENFLVYLKQFWFSNGIHNHASADKFYPACSQEYMKKLLQTIDLSKLENQTLLKDSTVLESLISIMFSETIAPKKICLDAGMDIVANSACNFYEDVTHDEVEEFYKKMDDPNNKQSPMIGLNSKLIKKDGVVQEVVYKLGGLYDKEIREIIFWLRKSIDVTENDQQKQALLKLIEYYETGDLKLFDDYNVLWVGDTTSKIDNINGFIENYGDPMGRKATWEAVVEIENFEATKRTSILSDNAQWFEDNSPVEKRFKKEKVKGVSARVIDVAFLGGDCYPSTPIGINLPNSSWIREQHGSKSITINNIMYTYDKVSMGSGTLEEFAFSQDEIDRAIKYGFLSHNIHVDLHECLGHGSGKNLEGVNKDALGKYYNTIEETRADLFALYYGYDKKLVDLGLIPNLDAGKSEYDSYIKGGLMLQLKRVELGKNLEEAHMRNRQLIAKWALEKGNGTVIERKVKEGKTYFVINDYDKLKEIFGQLLAEIQRIKSEGDFKSAMELVENYAVKVDQELHKEVLQRFEALNLPSYSGFVNPEFIVDIKDGNITDIKLDYTQQYVDQMIKYSKTDTLIQK